MRTHLRLLTAVLAVGILGAVPGGPAGLRYKAVGFAQGATPSPPVGQQPASPAPGGEPPAAQPPTGQQPAPNAPDAQQPPRIRSGINYVSVDVIVTDKDGKPVLDMSQDDFTVAEDGKPQKIDAFTVIKVDGNAAVEEGPPRAIKDDVDEEREAAKPEVRLFVLFFDDYHVARGNDMSVRKPLIDFMQNQLAPADMIAIMYPLTPVTDLRFSRDRASAITAIDHFEGRKFDYRPRNSFEAQYAEYPASTVERIRNQITMSALEGAAVKMGGLREGRKSIIWVSEGFTAMLPAQLSDPVASMPGLNNPNRGNASAPQATDFQQLIARSDLISDMQHSWATINRQNTSIYAVDPRGLAVFQYDINVGVGINQDAQGLRASLDTLHEMAENTDGRAILNRNDLAVGMKQIMRDSSGYYLLGYN
ncbi:MAG: VWA domain-containing protein, partial [Acidobacteriota bacterium]